MSENELVIPGYPTPTKNQVQMFQKNNRCKVDGIVGPQTMAACWPGVGNEYFAVRLAPYRYRHGGAGASIVYARGALRHYVGLPVHSENMLTLFEIVSSRWSCGFDWLTGEDGLTVGFRRYASTKAGELLRSYYRETTRERINEVQEELCANRDSPNNGGVVGKFETRVELLRIQPRKDWWDHQIRDTMDDWAEAIFRRYPRWRSGRMIAVAVRAYNSGTSYLRNLPQDEEEAYLELCRRYTSSGSERRREHRQGRIDQIEEMVSAEEIWR